MFILKSSNPQFSFILRKNPATQRSNNAPFDRAFRKGKLYGWYTNNDQEFRCLFIDSDTETSLINAKSNFEYLDRTRYSSPYLPIAMIGEFMRSVVRNRDAHDVPGMEHQATFIIEIVNVRLANAFITSFPSGTCEIEQLCGTLHKATFRTTDSLYYLLNAIQVFCVMQTVADPNLYLPLDEASYMKYVRSVVAIDSPYFVRYMLNKQVSSVKTFQAAKELLQRHSTHEINMHFGDTHQQRINAILRVLQGGKVLWDIGCGELRYTRKLAGKYNTVVAYDADEKIVDANISRVEKHNLSNVTIEKAFVDDTAGKHYDETSVDQFDILATEVIEHIEYDTAMQLLKYINQLDFRTLVITVPNREFNQHYKLDGFRHDDHKWEPSFDEFHQIIHSTFTNRKITVANLGDSVDNVSTSIIAIIERN